MTAGATSTRSDSFFAWACLLCAVPVLLAHYPPMVDLPGHAAQIASVRGKLDGSWPFASMFEFEWFTPYWLGYGATLLLSLLVDITWALKLVLAGATAALPWSAARFCRRMGAHPGWCWMLLAMPFGFAYDWGFLNFLVAAPLGFLFLVKVLDFKEDKTGWLTIVAWLHLLFLAHILITAFFCVIALLLMAAPWRGTRDWVRRCLPILSILPLTVAWVLVTSSKSPSAADPVLWAHSWQRVLDLVPSMVSAPTLPAAGLIGMFFIAVPWLMGARPRRSWLAWAPFLTYVTWMLAVPDYVGGNLFTYQRFALFGLPLYLIGFETGARIPARQEAVLRCSLALVCLSLIGWHGLRAHIFNSETRDYLAVIGHADPGKRMLNLTFDPMSRTSRAPVFLHFPGWYQAQQSGLTEFSFSKFYVTPLKFKNDESTRIELGFEWNPASFDWGMHQGDVYDYVIMRTTADPGEWIGRKSGGRLELKAHYGAFWLYHRASPQVAH